MLILDSLWASLGGGSDCMLLFLMMAVESPSDISIPEGTPEPLSVYTFYIIILLIINQYSLFIKSLPF